MIDVYVRDVLESKGGLLGQFRPGDILALVNLLSEDGFTVYTGYDEDAEFVCARFDRRDGRTIFEILVETPGIE